MLQASKSGMTVEEIAEKLKVNIRTVRRDLEFLKEKWDYQFVVTTAAHGLRRYRLEASPSPDFTFEEAAALCFGLHVLAPLEKSSLARSANQGMDKIKGRLKPAYMEAFGRLLNIFHQTMPGRSNYAEQAKIIDTLVVACEDGSIIEIRYAPRGGEDEKTYRIQPCALVMQNGTLYLVGLYLLDLSGEKNKMRIWKLNRIIEVEKSETKLPKLEESVIDDFRRKGFGVFVFDDRLPQKIRIKVDGYMAKYVQEHHWHETQQFKQQGKNCVIVQFEVVPTRELTNWILTLGCNAEVLHPKSLRQEVAKEIAKMHQKYDSR